MDDRDQADEAFFFEFPVYLVVDRDAATRQADGEYELTDSSGFFRGREAGHDSLFVFTDVDLARRAACAAGLAKPGVVRIDEPRRLAGLLLAPAMRRFHTVSFDAPGTAGARNRWAFPTAVVLRRFGARPPRGGE